MIRPACNNTEHVATNHEHWHADPAEMANPAEQEDAP